MKNRKAETAIEKPAMVRPAVVAVCALLALSVLLVYFPTFGYGFVEYDDPAYLTENPHVAEGLSWHNVGWAFTTSEAANWVPLTWLSHMADFSVFGNRAGAHHAVNVVLHAANAILLFLLLLKLTRRAGMGFSQWSSAVVAALFALHPLHVESVAWVSERKDVLSAFFGFLAIGAYARYAEKPAWSSYLLILPLYALSLMAKPMLVTLPVLLLLLDYWPLRRLDVRRPWGPLLEKLPLAAIAVAVSVAAIYMNFADERIGQAFPFFSRFGNAVIAYARYLQLTAWPAGLSVIYPFPGVHLPFWQVIISATLLGALSAFAFMAARSMPWILVGWLWYVISLLPVSNIIQIHNLAMADRYTYLPHIGLFMAVAWGVGAVVENRKPRVKIGVAVLTMACLIAFGVLSHFQVGHWRDSISLFKQALRSTSKNIDAHMGLGNAYAAENKYKEAEDEYRRAVESRGPYTIRIASEALNNWGAVLFKQAQQADNSLDAEELFGRSLRKHEEAYKADALNFKNLYNWGNVLGALALRRSPLDASILFRDAALKYGSAIALAPDNVTIHYNMANLFVKFAMKVPGEKTEALLEEACKEFETALRIQPGLTQALNNWGVAEFSLAKMRKGSEAAESFIKAEAHFMAAEKQATGAAAYNLACLHAVRDNERECRNWLEVARLFGKMPRRAQLEADPDLESVREKDWFKDLLNQLGA